MKKVFIGTLILALGASLVSCNSGEENVSFLIPNGTPLIAMSGFLSSVEDKNYDIQITEGSDALTASFANADKDIIVAPINLGANMYSKNKNYVLFETVIWGSLYVASKTPITSFNDLDSKTITVFGTNQTPDIIMKSLALENDITYETNRVNAVAEANSLFIQNQADYIVTSEPSLTMLKTKVATMYTLDLQDEWEKVSHTGSYPQAGVFVKSSKAEELKSCLESISSSITNLPTNLDNAASYLIETGKFTGFSKEMLLEAIPNCHIGLNEQQKEAIEFYFNKLIALGLGASMGGALPDEDFYYSL